MSKRKDTHEMDHPLIDMVLGERKNLSISGPDEDGDYMLKVRGVYPPHCYFIPACQLEDLAVEVLEASKLERRPPQG